MLRAILDDEYTTVRWFAQMQRSLSALDAIVNDPMDS